MSSDVWDKIQRDLDELLDDQSFEKLHPLIDNWKQWSSAQPPPHPPEFYEALIKSVKQMNKELKSGKPFEQVLEKATNEDNIQFLNPNWDVRQVLQAQTIIKFSINNFAKEMKDEAPDPKIEIPLLLLVMNDTQAEELDNGEVFNAFQNGPYAAQFTNLRDRLDRDWLKRYRKSPEDWQPFSNRPITIKELVTTAFQNITGYEERLAPKFMKIDNLVEETNRRALRQLRKNGCIVIMDAISIQHPDIQKTLRRALLDVYPNMFVVRVASSTAVLEIEQQMIDFCETYVDLEFYKRLTLDDDDDSCQQVHQDFEFRKWLATQVSKKMIPSDVKTQAGIRKHMFSKQP